MSAKILAHSCIASPFASTREASEIATLELCYPRFIHSEFMTHRHISRNARSSRAVPVQTLIAEVAANPVIPSFRENKKGMQPGEYLAEQGAARQLWLDVAAFSANKAAELVHAKVHKQWANRLLEPFSKIHVVATASMFWWGSFLALRDHPAAQDEIQELAQEIESALVNSNPAKRNINQWHAPYLQPEDFTPSSIPFRGPLVSAARCARVSYKPFDQETASIDKDLALAQKLIESNHASPFEHVCTPGPTSGNLPGWQQLRHILERT
jgi:thymidylate synthase ThyX